MAPRARALLLDLDDTLLDNRGIPEAVRRACEEIAGAVGGIDPGELERTSTATWREVWSHVERSCWLGRLDGFAASREFNLCDEGAPQRAVVGWLVRVLAADVGGPRLSGRGDGRLRVREPVALESGNPTPLGRRRRAAGVAAERFGAAVGSGDQRIVGLPAGQAPH